MPTATSRALVRRRFDRAAAAGEFPSFLDQEVQQRMGERLAYLRLEPRTILDLGCGAGAFLPHLKARFPQASLLLGLDGAPAMLEAARPHCRAPSYLRRLLGRQTSPHTALLGGRAEALPLASGQVDFIWSNQMLHWVEDPRAALAEMHRVLAVDGLLMFSTLGPDTLKELRSVFPDGDVHTQPFLDMHDWGDMLVTAGFADPVMDMEMLTLTYEDFSALLRECRFGGNACAAPGHRRGLGGRRGGLGWGPAMRPCVGRGAYPPPWKFSLVTPGKVCLSKRQTAGPSFAFNYRVSRRVEVVLLLT